MVGTTAMLDAFVRHDALPEHVVLTSSRAVYGEGPWRAADGTVFEPRAALARPARGRRSGRTSTPTGRPATPLAAAAATTHPNPSSVYGSTKLAQELVLRNWSASFSVPLSVFRLQNVYGPGQSPHNPYTGIITLFHRLASRGETLDVYEDGEINRDFVYIDDVVSALVRGIDAPPADQRILDVGNGVMTTIHDAARMIAAHHGAPEPQVSGKFRDGDVRSAWADITATPRRSAGRRSGPSRPAARRCPTGSSAVVSLAEHEFRPPAAAGTFTAFAWVGAERRPLAAGDRPAARGTRTSSGLSWRSGATRSLDLLPEDDRVEVVSAGSFAEHGRARCRRPCRGPVLLMTSPGAGARRWGWAPPSRRWTATPGSSSVSFLSNAAGHLSFPQTNRPTQYSLEGHDETTLTRLLRASEPRLEPAPIAAPAGGATLVSRDCLVMTKGPDDVFAGGPRPR